MLRPALLLLPLFAVCLANFRWSFPINYQDLLIKPLSTSFSCDNRPFGYYADVENNCQIYHVCVPFFDATGDHKHTYMFSFICGNQTIFSQDILGCASLAEAYPCEDAPSLFDFVNAKFGNVPEIEEDI
ncbi:U-scoloptoxin(01)-Cw1a-like [Portunus trituberculatus]|uniref:U-scoloptoxin(01)-Cw1a-like n=1 Tax=Portunus trituberculatus TaxID=210409 RepID=UPI001E1D219A|nr:U-scoloptoxin(01)-Cw1a-like [Portunus trituberculatus]